jgi:hypothetical protein
MRLVFLCVVSLALSSVAFAGEIIVYTQTWTGKTLLGEPQTTKGKGYILIDLENRKVTQIAVGKLFFGQNGYRVETYSDTVFAEPENYYDDSTFLAVQGTEKYGQPPNNWQRTIFLKGRETLLTIGPSQQKQVPKAVSGIKRMVYAFFSSKMVEESFAGVFNAKLTNDTNANSRTLEAEVELLTSSLEEAGYHLVGS